MLTVGCALSLSSHYRKFELHRYSEGADFATPAGFDYVCSFKGLVQVPSNSNTFRNGKDTSTVGGILYCPLAMNSKIKEGDKVKDTLSGQFYIVSGAGSQPLGVAGLSPAAGQHCEFNVDFDDGSK